jgi:hypothetical protein
MAPSFFIRSAILISLLSIPLFAQGWELGMRVARVTGHGLTFVTSVPVY